MHKSIFQKLLNLTAAVFFSFVLAPVYAAPQLLVEPEQGRQPILDAVKQAQSRIDLAMYGFTDPDLMQAFIQAKEQGKQVRILLQHYPYRNLDENQPAIQRFSASRLNLTFAPPSFYLLHQKTLLIDQRKALVLSFNFTRSAFKNERNFGLVLDDSAEVREIQSVFNADWENKKVSPQSADLVWSPDNSREKILNLIKSAKSEIKVYAQGLTDYQVVGALADAARQGLKVQVLSSGSQLGKKWGYLRDAGVLLGLDKRLVIHAKVVIVDQKKALLGSINFTQASLEKNRELSVVVSDPQVVKQLSEVFEKDWKDTK
jgi:phosphatidylserine/phosphatidylglycerophosphate/cardiolipin synthase-like enzyme